MPVGYFTHIIIDEAGEALEPEALVPFQLAGGSDRQTTILLAGDHKQLGTSLRMMENHCSRLEQLFGRVVVAAVFQ